MFTYGWSSASGGSCADCKLDLATVGPSLLSVLEAFGSCTDGRIHVVVDLFVG